MGADTEREGDGVEGGMVPTSLRLGRRRRVREAERVAAAIEAITRALQPLEPAARVRVLTAAAVLLDVQLAGVGEPGGGG